MITAAPADLSEVMSRIPEADRLLNITIPGKKYYDTVEALTRHILQKRDSYWVYVTATRPFESFVRRYREIGNATNIKYVDVISHASNVAQKDSRCSYIPSPTMLEHVLIELEVIFDETPSGYNKFVVIDSLTNLTVYNNPDIVVEFFYQLINKTASIHANVVSLLVEEECSSRFAEQILHLHDEMIKIQDIQKSDSSSEGKEVTEREKIIKKMDWNHDEDFFKENRI